MYSGIMFKNISFWAIVGMVCKSFSLLQIVVIVHSTALKCIVQVWALFFRSIEGRYIKLLRARSSLTIDRIYWRQ